MFISIKDKHYNYDSPGVDEMRVYLPIIHIKNSIYKFSNLIDLSNLQFICILFWLNQ